MMTYDGSLFLPVLFEHIQTDSKKAILRNEFSSIYTNLLDKFLESWKDMIRNYRSGECYRYVSEIISCFPQLDLYCFEPDRLHNQIKFLYHDMIDSELEYIKFRRCFSNRAGLYGATNIVESILSQSDPACAFGYVSSDMVNLYNKELKEVTEEIQQAEGQNKKNLYQQTELDKMIESGNIEEAHKIALRERKPIYIRLIADLVSGRLRWLSKKNKRKQSNEALLKELFEFNKTFSEIIHHYNYSRKNTDSDRMLYGVCRTLLSEGISQKKN